MYSRVDSFAQRVRFKYIMKLMEDQTIVIQQQHHLKRAELDVLYFLSRSGELDTSTDIRRVLLMNRGHVSQTMERLRRKKLLVAIQDETDRRYIHYQLTGEACEIAREVAEVWERIEQTLFHGITRREQETLYRITEKIAWNLERVGGEEALRDRIFLRR